LYKAIGANIRERVVVKHWFVIASDPNTNQLPREIAYQITDVTGNNQTIQAKLVLAVLQNEMFPFHSIVPAYWPGLFGGQGQVQA
jgi:hypothetical protein